MYFFLSLYPIYFPNLPEKQGNQAGFISRHPVLKRARIKLNREMTECLFVLHLGESLVTSACGHSPQPELLKNFLLAGMMTCVFW